MYADYQRYIDIAASTGTVAGNDAWMYEFCRNQVEVQGGWDRQIVPPYIEYTTDQDMLAFTTGAYEQWMVVQTNGLNPAAPIVVVDDLRGTVVPINQAPHFVKQVIETGSVAKADAHAGVMQAIAIQQPNWIQGPTTIDGNGNYKTRWVIEQTDPVNNGVDTSAIPTTVLTGLLKRLHTEAGQYLHGGYILTNQPRIANAVGELNNPGRISVYIYQDTNQTWVMCKLSTLAIFNSFLHPSDADGIVSATGNFFDPGRTVGFVNPHQLVCHMEAGASTENSWIDAGCIKLIDVRRSGSELPVPIEEAFYGVIPRDAGSGRGESIFSGLSSLGSKYLSLNGVVRITDALDGEPLASPHCAYWQSVRASGSFAPGAAQWASGIDDAVDSRGEIYEPWIAYNPFSSTTQAAYLGQKFDCILINDGNLVEGSELIFDGRTFKVYTRVRGASGRPFAQFAFRVGHEDDALPHP